MKTEVGARGQTLDVLGRKDEIWGNEQEELENILQAKEARRTRAPHPRGGYGTT